MEKYIKRDIAVTAREIIDLYYENDADSQIIESLSRICFSLARIFENNNDSKINWDSMFSYFDQKYMSLNNNSVSPKRETIDKIYTDTEKIISKFK